MENTKHKRLTGKTYKPEGMLYWGLLLGLLLMLIHFLLMISFWREEFMWAITFILLPLYGYGIWEMFIRATQTSITLYKDGIEWQRGGSRLFTTWDNVSHLGCHGKGESMSYGIFLHKKVKPEVNGLIESLAYGRESNYILLTGLLSIPTQWSFRRDTTIDLDKLSQTDFGRTLMHYAPHLFEKGKGKPKHRLSDEEEQMPIRDRLRYENMLNQDLEHVES